MYETFLMKYLHYACRGGHIECVRLLMSVPDIDVNIRDIDDFTPYQLADKDIIRRLLLQKPIKFLK